MTRCRKKRASAILQNRSAIPRFAAGDEIAVDHGLLIEPFGACIAQVRLEGRPRGGALAAGCSCFDGATDADVQSSELEASASTALIATVFDVLALAIV